MRAGRIRIPRRSRQVSGPPDSPSDTDDPSRLKRSRPVLDPVENVRQFSWLNQSDQDDLGPAEKPSGRSDGAHAPSDEHLA
jgi:hypothetical protein